LRSERGDPTQIVTPRHAFRLSYERRGRRSTRAASLVSSRSHSTELPTAAQRAHRGEADPAAIADDERDLAVEPGWQVG